MKYFLILFIFVSILTLPIFSQELKEIDIETVPESESMTFIIRNPNEAILIVRSTIPDLNFESSRSIIGVDSPDPGEYRLHLEPGTHIITFKADGYLPIKDRFHIPKKEFKEVRIKPKSLMILEEEKAYEVTFELNVDNVYCSYEQFAPIMKKESMAKFKLPAGEYTFRFEKDQYKAYTEKIKVEKDQTFQITLVEDKSQRVPYRPPGIVTIESDPPGAEVLVNGQKIGSTPFSGELTSGKHRLEIRNNLYYPHLSDFTLEAGETKRISHSLKPRFGYLSVLIQPQDAEIFLDGKSIDATPIDKKHVMSGKHRIMAKKDSYHNYETIFEIQDNQKKIVEIVLDPAIVSLAINSSPEDGAEVWIDDELRGVTPFEDNYFPVARYDEEIKKQHKLELRKSMYYTYTSNFNLEPGKPKEISCKLMPKFGYLKVVSHPEGAKIFLDNKQIGIAPISEKNVMSGKHKLLVKKDLYHDYETDFEIEDDQKKTIEFSLNPAFGTLEIHSLPEEGAEVFIDGVRKGVTPLKYTQFLSGKYTIEVRKEYYNPASEGVEVSDREIVNRTLIMSSNVGILSVDAKGCDIFLDSKNVGINHFEKKLSPGKYVVKAEKEKHYPEEREIFLSVDETEKLNFNLMPKQGSVSVKVEPYKAHSADIYINDNFKGPAPKVITLLIGNYNVEVKHKQYLPQSESIEIMENQNKQLSFNLMTYEGSRIQKKNSWKRRRNISLASTIASAGASAFLYMQEKNNYEKYQNANTVENAQNYRKSTETMRLMSQISFSVSISSLAGSVYSYLQELKY